MAIKDTKENRLHALVDEVNVPRGNARELSRSTPEPPRGEQTPPKQTTPKRAKNSERLEIRLSPELKRALQRAADTEQTDLAEILRKSAREYLAGKGYL